MQNDRALARRIGKGERSADEEFLQLFGARVQRLVRRSVASNADAEDITQEIFIDLFRCAAAFRGEASLSTWVLGVAYNHCRRYHARRPGAAAEAETSAEPVDATADPARSALRSELSGQVRGAVARLAAHHRDVVLLHELDGLTYAQCAEVLSIPVGTVKSRLCHALRALRHNLGSYVLNENEELPPGPAARLTEGPAI